MPEGTIGIAAMGGDSNQVLATIKDFEQRGIKAAWLTGGAGGLDALALFAAAATQTERILLGTCIITILPRHPITTTQQVQVIDQLAPGRFRFGVGTGHARGMESTFGIDFNEPLAHLREYLTIARTMLSTGAVEFEGRHYRANGAGNAGTDRVPVLAAALRSRAYEVCGGFADGAISWVSPGTYLRDVALPAMAVGAKREGRPTPPLVAHVPVCVHENQAEVLEAARQQLATYPKSPFYQLMFKEAGFPEAAEIETWSEGMTEAVVLSGTEERVAERIAELFGLGISEIIVSVVTAGSNAAASRTRTLDLLSSLSSA